ncbi:hypothetical protein GDO78_016667 [Eleutherodactylus coqui]|uniref:BRCT domain-containing protein n=1 Tax=Eleutherodactylus coqui TaxID=57060 RepID=A0A8J6EKX1_ELECQ|nr:hypothetical protein GDO78_016667 [Eleutherodactylus coqui]
MPEIKLKHVVSCSSADSTHTAENLLKPDTYRKWKAQHAGEKQISVILQFEKEEQIHSIDIGNEGSAFVEVLAGHSTSVSEQEYEVILGMSSFMSPSESKNGSNLNRTRMFGGDKLVKAAAEKKWDRVKIVCTQPYTKNLAYGLSFIRFHSPPDKDDPPPSSPKVTKLGHFKVKEEESSSPSMRPGSLFFNRTNKTEITPPKAPQTSYAAVALQGTSSTETSAEKPITKTPPSSTTPKDPSSGKRKFEFKKESSSHPHPKASPSHSKESNSQPLSKKIKAEVQPAPSVKKTPPPEKTSHKKTPPSSQPVELNRLLQGTVFVLSGFQNPFRSDLRDKALEMGAKYRPDWTPDSTHLIYLMDGADSSSEEDDYSDDDSPPRHKAPTHRPEQKDAAKKEPRSAPDDPYAGSTDENTDVEEEPEVEFPIPELPDLFVGKHFFLYGEFPPAERRLLQRYITAFNGELEEYMNEKVHYVITAQEWDDSFEEALNDNTSLYFVRPRWIYNCNERQKCIPHQPYVVVPQA